MAKEIIGMAIGNKFKTFESTKIADLESKISKVDANTATINAFIEKLMLKGGEDYTYLNVNKWILRMYTDQGRIYNYSWCRLWPVIGDYVYVCNAQSKISAVSNFKNGTIYATLCKNYDVSNPTLISKMMKRTASNIYPTINSSLNEIYEPLEDELLVKIEWDNRSTVSNTRNYTLPEAIVLDYPNAKASYTRFIGVTPDTGDTSGIWVSFEIIKSGKQENKYIRGLLAIPSGNVNQFAFHNGISLLNNNVVIGEIDTDIRFTNNDVDKIANRVYYFNLNPLNTSIPYNPKA